jgi:hypothetical protein
VGPLLYSIGLENFAIALIVGWIARFRFIIFKKEYGHLGALTYFLYSQAGFHNWNKKLRVAGLDVVDSLPSVRFFCVNIDSELLLKSTILL